MEEQKKRPRTAVLAFMQDLSLHQDQAASLEKEEESPEMHQRIPAFKGMPNALSEQQLYSLPSGKKCRFITKTVDSKKCKVWIGNARDQNKISREELDALKASINAQGQLVPILARPNKKDDSNEISHEIIYGSRRLKACQELNLPIKIIEADILDEDALFFMDAENAAREDLSIYEKALTYKKWLDEKIFSSQEDLAQKIGLSRQWLIKSLNLLKLPSFIIDALPKYKDLTRLRGDQLRAFLEKYPAMEERLKVAINSLSERNTDYTGDELFEVIFNEFKKNIKVSSERGYWEERDLISDDGEKILTVKKSVKGKLKLEVSKYLSEKKAIKLIENLERLIKRL